MSNTIEDWLEEQRINGGSHGFECIGIARMQQVWDAAREELEQQISANNQDAARYTWLRKSDSSKRLAIAEWSNEDGEWIVLGFKPEDIDAAIDKELK